MTVAAETRAAWPAAPTVRSSVAPGHVQAAVGPAAAAPGPGAGQGGGQEAGFWVWRVTSQSSEQPPQEQRAAPKAGTQRIILEGVTTWNASSRVAPGLRTCSSEPRAQIRHSPPAAQVCLQCEVT